MTIDELVDQLAKPIFVLRMARPMEQPPSWVTDAMHKSGKQRAFQARQDIDTLVRKYVESQRSPHD